MKNKQEIKAKIEAAVDSWNEEKTVADYFRKKLGQSGNAEKVFYNIVEKSLAEEKPDWTKVLLDTMKVENQAVPQVNLFTVANQKISDSLQKIIDVTPKKVKKGIEGII